VSGRQVVWYFSHGPAVTDLRIFMTGVDMVRSGQGKRLYQFDAQEKTQVRLYPETRGSGLLPFNHLAYELLFYWPVSGLSYRMALIAWALANLGFLFLIAWLLAPDGRSLNLTTGTPLVLYLLAFYPVMYVLGEGQDSIVFLLLVVLSLRSLDRGWIFLAGLLLALACFKFHLALMIVFFVFLLRGKWHGLAGFATGAVVVGGISLALVGPAIFHDYMTMLRRQELMTPWGFIPWFMPNVRGFLQWWLARWLDAGLILPVVFMSSAVVGVVAAWFVLRKGALGDKTVRGKANGDESMVYSLAILTTLLVSYHLHMQDLTLALLPMLVLVDRSICEWQEGGAGRGVEAKIGGAQPLAIKNSTIQNSTVWTAASAAAIAGFYLYRIAAELFPILLMRGCLLAVPVFVLWMVALRWWRTCRFISESATIRTSF
jgi:Glycosyltransferase family 87